MIIEKPNQDDIRKQCDSNNYQIPIDIISTGLSSGNANIQYSLDGTTTWINYAAPYSINNRYVLTIPKENITLDDGISIRFWLDKPLNTGVNKCYSDEIYYDKTEMTLPSVNMTKVITKNGPDNDGNYTYSVTVSGGLAPLTLTDGTVINSGIAFPISSPYTTTVTDNNGCTLNITN